jgi:hypothetical protein
MINSNFGFTPLKEVWLGDCYPESYYDYLPNEIADPFKQITQWTKEDTGRLQRFLESRGIIVRRPVFNSIDNFVNAQGQLAKPPVTPRDQYIVFDKTLYSLHGPKTSGLRKDPWSEWLDHYENQGLNVQRVKTGAESFTALCPPAVVRMGRDLYLDLDSHQNDWALICQWMVDFSKTHRVNICQTNGHSDGVFCPVAPQIIVSSFYKSTYTQSFPEWKTFRIPGHLHNFPPTEKKNTWWVNDSVITENRVFNQHIQQNAKDWVGNFHETVFEVNMLVLDEKNVIVMKDYAPLTEWLDKRGITVHCFDLRTRSFWDGGWHCFTLDIHREDTKKDLFPERGDNGIFWRLN